VTTKTLSAVINIYVHTVHQRIPDAMTWSSWSLQVVNENVRRPYVYCRDPDVFETLVVTGVPLQVVVNPSLYAKERVRVSLRLILVGSRAVTSVASRIYRRARPVLTLNWTNWLMRILCQCR